MKIFCFAVVLAVSLACLFVSSPAFGANSPRRSVECRVFSKLYSTIHDRVKSLDDVGIAQQFMSRLENDIGALNLVDPTLTQIQQKYVSNLHEMALIFKNIREGQLVGDRSAMDRMLPFVQATSEQINASTTELNNYCQGVWNFRPIGGQ